MGILTNPDSNHGKGFLTKISKHGKTLSWFLFLCGILFIFVMPHPEFSHHVYFSENALLPGLVREDYVDDGTVTRFLEELRNETMGYYDIFPHRWLRNKYRQLGLEVFTHTFKLTFPLGPNSKRSNTTGKNIYAILRAPRASSTEALVLTVPFRPPYSLDPNTDISLALMYGAASFFRTQNHWAKDIIFLITQHEQLGMQAWLEAYHQIPGSIIDYGDLNGRAGSIQAAINLEVSTDRISHVNVKVEGLNGQLPNLDLVNLVNRLCLREGLPQMFQGVEDHKHPSSWKGYWRSWKTMINMALRQATGTPSGNHGLFHKFGIESVTIEGVLKKKSSVRGGAHPVPQIMGKIIEGTFRSLNNLLEKFHQSFFFYLLPSSSRYISIGMYMPGFGLLGSGLVLSALCLWFKLQQELTEKKGEGLKESSKKGTGDLPNDPENDKSSSMLPFVLPPSVIPVLPQIVIAHLLGLAFFYLPSPSTVLLDQFHIHHEDSVILALLASTLAFLMMSVVRPLKLKSSEILTCVVYLEIAALAYGMSLCNFGLAYLVTSIYVPTAFLSYPWRGTNKIFALARSLLLILSHPLILLFAVCFVDTALTFSNRSIISWIPLTYNATKHALMYSVTDWFIYGNFNFPIGCLFLLPCWSQLWMVHTSRN